MTTYLIEIPHSEDTVECQHVIKLFVDSGSHLLSHAWWGCKSGVHKSFFISEFDSKEEALQTVPPFLRRHANIIELVTFSKMIFSSSLTLTSSKGWLNRILT